MILVPRQLQRAGMTGNVPYYGGRFTPAQAYAASHPHAQPPPAQPAVVGTRGNPGHVLPASHPPPHPPENPTGQLEALRHLRDTGVITSTEYQELCDRVGQC
jgi:hypothetical protein